MCHQTDMGLQTIEELYLQGMPRKIGKSVEQTLLKRKNCIKCKNDVNSINNNENNCKCVHKMHSVRGYKSDLLAIGTKYTRQVFQTINNFIIHVKNSNSYKMLSKTTQPAHVIAIGILLFVLLAIWPNLLESENENDTNSSNDLKLKEKKSKNILSIFAYLGAFATHFGAQIWMTFVSGLSLYFALPRHTFGLCQQILFPKYFAMNSILSICTLIMFIKVIGGRWEFSSYVQVIALTLCAFIEVTVRLYLAPPLLRLMREKHKFEIGIGSGTEIGHLEQRDLINCPHYQKIHKSFRRIHMTVAMGNLTTLVCTFLHLHYLASKISVS